MRLWLRHVFFMFFEPWPRHMTSCLFCSSVEMPEVAVDNHISTQAPEEIADFVTQRIRRRRG